MAGHKIVGEKNESSKQDRIVNQWRAFSRTEAFKDYMEYAQSQQDMLIKYAEELQMPGPMGKGMIPITGEMANFLLQNRRGIGIMTSYARLRAEKQG